MPEPFSIRDFRNEDFEGLINLWIQTGLSKPERGDDLKVIQSTLNSGGKLWVMINRHDKIIGSSWITNDGRRLYLHHFGILPAYQGQGLSKHLLEKSMEFAKSTDLQIKLEVHKTNKIAIKLYEQYGFKYLGDYFVYIVREYL